MTLLIQTICVLVNVPGMLTGNPISFIGFGACLGLLIITLSIQ